MLCMGNYLPEFQQTENVQIKISSSWTWHLQCKLLSWAGYLLLMQTSCLGADLTCVTWRKSHSGKNLLLRFSSVSWPGVLKPWAKSQPLPTSGKPIKQLPMWKFLCSFPHCSPNNYEETQITLLLGCKISDRTTEFQKSNIFSPISTRASRAPTPSAWLGNSAFTTLWSLTSPRSPVPYLQAG